MYRKVQRNIFFITVLCAAIGLLVRLAYCIKYPVQPRDAYLYESVVLDWEENNEIPEKDSNYQLSLWLMKYPYEHLGVEIIKSGIIVNMVIGVFIIIILSQEIGRQTQNLFATFFAGIIAATHPMLIRNSCVFLRENTYLLFTLLSFVFLYRYYKKNNVFYLILIALFNSLSFLCRQEGWEMFAITLIIICYLCFNRTMSYKKAFCHCILLLMISVVLIEAICSTSEFKRIRYGHLQAKLYEEQL